MGVSDVLNGGKKSICINLKHPEGIQIVEKLATRADVLLEPYRPGKKNLFFVKLGHR